MTPPMTLALGPATRTTDRRASQGAVRRRTLRMACQRGSSSVSMTILVPLFILMLFAVVFAGRTALAHQNTEAIAAAAARSASLARTPSDARAAARQIATATASSRGLPCAPLTVDVDTSGFAARLGVDAEVTVTVNCALATADLAMPGIPGHVIITAASTSPIDTYRARGPR